MSISAQLDDLSAMVATELADPDHQRRRQSDTVLEEMFEVTNQINITPTFSAVADYNEIHEDEMKELVGKIRTELTAGDSITVILLRSVYGSQRGTVARVASSEAAWLIRCGAAREATDAEIAEASTNSAPSQPPLKSWARYRDIKNKCQALRPHPRVK